MTRDLRPRRLLLTDAELAVVRGDLPPPPGWLTAAPAGAGLERLRERGLADAGPHPALVADLARLAAPELGVLVEARCPDGDVHAAVGVVGVLGTVLRRTGAATVELSAFAAVHLAAELSRLVPATAGRAAAAELPLEDAASVRACGLLRATVAGPGGVGCLDWAWLGDGAGGGWAAVEPAPAGRLRLRPVSATDLAPGVAAVAGLVLGGAR